MMHWREACLQSKDRKAFRKTKDGRIVIHFWDGGGCIESHSKRTVYEVKPEQLEGFMDWEPIDPINPKNIEEQNNE